MKSTTLESIAKSKSGVNSASPDSPLVDRVVELDTHEATIESTLDADLRSISIPKLPPRQTAPSQPEAGADKGSDVGIQKKVARLDRMSGKHSVRLQCQIGPHNILCSDTTAEAVLGCQRIQRAEEWGRLDLP